jgi:hypothetical protein
MNLHEVIIKNGRLAVFIRHDSAEIWGFRYGLKLGICSCLKRERERGGVGWVHVPESGPPPPPLCHCRLNEILRLLHTCIPRINRAAQYTQKRIVI